MVAYKTGIILSCVCENHTKKIFLQKICKNEDDICNILWRCLMQNVLDKYRYNNYVSIEVEIKWLLFHRLACVPTAGIEELTVISAAAGLNATKYLSVIVIVRV